MPRRKKQKKGKYYNKAKSGFPGLLVFTVAFVRLFPLGLYLGALGSKMVAENVIFEAFFKQQKMPHVSSIMSPRLIWAAMAWWSRLLEEKAPCSKPDFTRDPSCVCGLVQVKSRVGTSSL
ncbi:hypothetical protein AVEN_59311-1 [Araneus ventricosus]|uniref:Uncharacterized protein n=1 Tax=Araneus ventricosus TaxID=182803 RepID=A0A4Y2ITP6_ARAVE|nr:hypothetical protein AVEN_59311-1 [Araneus ventricosus]